MAQGKLKPMHGSVSQPSIDDLVLRYMRLLDIPGMDGNFLEAVATYEEICRRIGKENADIRINQMKKTFALLGVK